MQREIFADNVGALHVTGNLVRIDLMSIQPDADSSKNTDEPKQTLSYRLIIPLQGFINAFNLQEQAIRQLTKNGILVDGRIFPSSEES